MKKLALIFFASISIAFGAFADETKFSKRFASLDASNPHCKTEYIVKAGGVKVASVNCGLGQTCEDGKTCCRLGSSVSCCSSNEKCNEGICESK